MVRGGVLQTLSPALVERWDRLAVGIGAPPFVRPGWLRAWAEAFGRTDAMRLVTVERGGDLVAVLPVLGGPFGVRSTTNQETALYTPVTADPEAAAELAERLLGRPPARDRPGRRRRRRPGRRRLARRGPAGGRRRVRPTHAPLALHRRLRRPGRVPARSLEEPQARAQAAAQPHGRGRDRRVRRPRRQGGPSRAARRGVAAGGQGVEARGGLGGALLAHGRRVLRRRRALGGRRGAAAARLPAPVRAGDRVRVLPAVRVHAVVPQARHGRRPRQARAGGRAHPTFDRLRLRGSGAA